MPKSAANNLWRWVSMEQVFREKTNMIGKTAITL